MEEAFFYAGISLPLQSDKGELCESINEDKSSTLINLFIDLANRPNVFIKIRPQKNIRQRFNQLIRTIE